MGMVIKMWTGIWFLKGKILNLAGKAVMLRFSSS